MRRNILFVLALFLCTGLSAQMTLSTYPTTQVNNGNAGISFELTTTKTIILQSIDAALYSSGSGNFDIYYRIGGVQHSVGSPPNITAANGWTMLGSTSATGTAGVPTPIPLALNLVLTPGTYGIYMNSNNVGYRSWVSGATDTFTDGIVTIETGQNKGYGGGAPNPGFHPRQFVGAIHYLPVASGPNDAGVSSIDEPVAFCSGQRDIKATIENFGNNQITLVSVNWTFNGIAQTPVTYTDTLDTLLGTGPHSAQVTLGSKTFTAGVKDEIIVWTSNPNGVADTANSNDTAMTEVQPSLSGNYTIDPFGSGTTNYTSFTDAINDLNEFGVCAAVVFDVAEGTYNEQLSVDDIMGASATNTVTFKADPNNTLPVEINFAGSFSDNYIVKFNGASYVTFDDIDMISSGSYCTVIRMESNANHNTVMNCDLNGPVASTTSTNSTIIYSNGGSGTSHNQFINNLIHGGSYGVYYRGGSTVDLVPGVVFENNTVEDCYYRGMYFYYTEGLKIIGNKVHSSSGYTSGYGILSYYGDNGIQIMNNQVLSMGNNWPRYGLYAYYSDNSDTARGLVANNMIHVGNSSATLSMYGLAVYGNTYTDAVYNSVVLETSSTSGRAGYLYSGSQNTAYNNNFLNYGNGYAVYTLNGNFKWGNNNLATNGSNLGYYSGTVADINAWKASSGDTNSISVNNIYPNPDSLRTCSTDIYRKGKAIPAIMPYDFDGDMRQPDTTNIGADAYIATAGDFSIGDTIEFCGGSELEIGTTMNGGTFNWSTGASTPTIIVTEEGNYTVTVDGPCATGMVDDVEVIDVNPVANFTIQEGKFIGGFVNNSEYGTSYYWDFGDGSTSTEKEPWHKYPDNGPYTVTLTVMNYCDTVTFSQQVQFSVGLNEITFGSMVNVYPNPASNVINLAFGNIDDQNVQVELLDMRGQQISNLQVKATQNSVERMDVSSLPKGVYLIRLTTSDEVATKQVIVQ